MEIFETQSAQETQKLAQDIARKFQGGEVLCLEGDLGSGKTTFTQGLLKGLGIKGPYTSPTFVVMKEYQLKTKNHKLKTVFHIDAYRVNENDILNLGWNEILEKGKENIVIVEWADRIKNIIPKNAMWIKFEWVDEEKRKIIFE